MPFPLLRTFALSCALLAAAGCAAHGRRPAAPGTQLPDDASVQHGRTVFRAQCAACHGADGAGGPIGPSLRAESSRHSYAWVYRAIAEPSSAMPKLYPAVITKADLRDVSAYVETL